MKAFFQYFFLAGGMAFVLMFVVTFVIHLAWSAFSIESVIGSAIGCGFGTGLVNCVFAAFRNAG